MATVSETYPTESRTKIVYWDEVEGAGAEQYDESFLAALRNELKEAEENGIKMYIVPMRFSKKDSFWAAKSLTDITTTREAELFEQFTACMMHTARRIKDCKSVCGFALPDFKLDWSLLCKADNCKDYEAQFMTAFQKKHSHYNFIRISQPMVERIPTGNK